MLQKPRGINDVSVSVFLTDYYVHLYVSISLGPCMSIIVYKLRLLETVAELNACCYGWASMLLCYKTEIRF